MFLLFALVFFAGGVPCLVAGLKRSRIYGSDRQQRLLMVGATLTLGIAGLAAAKHFQPPPEGPPLEIQSARAPLPTVVEQIRQHLPAGVWKNAVGEVRQLPGGDGMVVILGYAYFLVKDDFSGTINDLAQTLAPKLSRASQVAMDQVRGGPAPEQFQAPTNPTMKEVHEILTPLGYVAEPYLDGALCWRRGLDRLEYHVAGGNRSGTFDRRLESLARYEGERKLWETRDVRLYNARIFWRNEAGKYAELDLADLVPAYHPNPDNANPPADKLHQSLIDLGFHYQPGVWKKGDVALEFTVEGAGGGTLARKLTRLTLKLGDTTMWSTDQIVVPGPQQLQITEDSGQTQMVKLETLAEKQIVHSGFLEGFPLGTPLAPMLSPLGAPRERTRDWTIVTFSNPFLNGRKSKTSFLFSNFVDQTLQRIEVDLQTEHFLKDSRLEEQVAHDLQQKYGPAQRHELGTAASGYELVHEQGDLRVRFLFMPVQSVLGETKAGVARIIYESIPGLWEHAALRWEKDAAENPEKVDNTKKKAAPPRPATAKEALALMQAKVETAFFPGALDRFELGEKPGELRVVTAERWGKLPTKLRERDLPEDVLRHWFDLVNPYRARVVFVDQQGKILTQVRPSAAKLPLP